MNIESISNGGRLGQGKEHSFGLEDGDHSNERLGVILEGRKAAKGLGKEGTKWGSERV